MVKIVLKAAHFREPRTASGCSTHMWPEVLGQSTGASPEADLDVSKSGSEKSRGMPAAPRSQRIWSPRQASYLHLLTPRSYGWELELSREDIGALFRRLTTLMMAYRDGSWYSSCRKSPDRTYREVGGDEDEMGIGS